MAEIRITFNGDYAESNFKAYGFPQLLRGGLTLFPNSYGLFSLSTTGDDQYTPGTFAVATSDGEPAYDYNAGVYFDASDKLFLNATGGNFGDVFLGSANADRLNGAGGNDQLSGNAGDDILEGGAGADVLDGGEGIDTASYAGAGDGVTVRMDQNQRLSNTGDAAGDEFISIENLTGSAYGDVLYGDTAFNTLSGAGGDDDLYGGDGADILIGGAGADYMEGGVDIWNDFVSYADASAGVTASLARPAQNTGDAAGDVYNRIEGLIGSAFNDTLKASGGSVLDGGAGNDRLFGSANGYDQLSGGDGNDRIRVGSQPQYVDGGGGKDTLFLSGGATFYDYSFTGIEIVRLGSGTVADFSGVSKGLSFTLDDTMASLLRGTAGDDVIVAGRGSNDLDGGDGADRLTGGDEGDTFRFTSVEARGDAIDAITDFSHADGDQIDLRGLNADPDPNGFRPVTFVDAFSASGAAEVLFRGDDAGGKLLLDFDGNGRWDHAIGITSDGPITSADVLTFAPD